MTREEEIIKVHGNGTHVVILGAGASYASTLRNPEKNGKKLPLMRNIVDIVGLQDIVKELPEDIRAFKEDFEKLYSSLCKQGKYSWATTEIELRIYNYFKELELPDEPTIYDYLVLSLRRGKDVIATFNWDPFLYQAYVRNSELVDSPGILFLHGTVALGYDAEEGRAGPVGYFSKNTYNEFLPIKLLYPVDNKDYNSDPYIKGQWDGLANRLNVAERVTIFGYSAPITDVEAIELLQKAWGTPERRNMEEFELIDIRPQAEVRKSWKTFIHSHHYGYGNNFFESSLANHPRRSVESYHHWAMPLTPSEAFQEGNPVPQSFRHLHEMWEWYRPLVEAEDEFYKAKP
ncbi:hypothetical protein GCM10023189_06870 [Nibrella saemangeumensis]|uniref:SIR2-like domain-containing protein n=1 Tax=Nibrella saemangeumensis TaxID=1084526 RepID=A0ABP8MFD2_9BACT